MSEQHAIPDNINPDFPLWCTEEEDGSLTIHWDENHPVTSVFNSWTEDDFRDMLLASATEVIERFDKITIE